MPKIIDAFPFYNELDMLEFRLKELYDVVDLFLIVESPVTFNGTPKPLFYVENQERYAFAAHKIRHVVSPLPSSARDAWDRERIQRDHIASVLQKMTSIDATDIVVVSDADEIVDARILEGMKQEPMCFPLVHFHMDFYYYTLEYRNDSEMWIKAFACPVAVARCMPSMSTLRNNPSRVVRRSGWHLSYFMSPEMIRNKLTEFAHQEFNTDAVKDSVQRSVDKKINFLTGKDLEYVALESNDYLPKHYQLLSKW